MNQKVSLNAILELIGKALNKFYSCKSFTQKEIDVGILVNAIGGPRLVFALNQLGFIQRSQRFWHHSIAVPLPFYYPLVSKTVTFPRSPFPLRYHFYWDRFWIEDTWKCSKFHITKRYLPFFLNHFQPLTGINLKKPFFTVSGRFYLETVPIEMVT